MSYERIWTVTFGDSDPFGIAHYPSIVTAMHETSEEFVRSLGYSYAALAEAGRGLPLVEVHAEFERPVRADDQIRIELTSTLGESSVRFDYEGVRDGERVFHGYEQRVYAEADGGSLPLPDDLRTALSTAND
jgi:4-hydroxybenzoyl-CoA thioesterase